MRIYNLATLNPGDSVALERSGVIWNARVVRANDRGAVFESELGRESVFSAELNTWVTITL